MKKMVLVLLLACACAACSPHGGAPVASAAPVNGMAALGPAPAAGSPAEKAAQECTSYGLKTGTAEYNDCLSGMTEAEQEVANNPDEQEQDNPSATPEQRRAQMRADAQRERAAMDQRMDQEEKRAADPASGCVTTHQGTNVSITCPELPHP